MNPRHQPDREQTRHDEPRSVPGIGGPGSSEASPDGQSALKLHAGISVIGALLCAFVTVVFLWLGSLTPAIVFAVIGLASLGWLGWTLRRRRRGREESRG
ncbi:hypothetical protein [Pseudonocardia sp. KRD291]|uniref:hypothetical protein n=1 Tax=Pseudonocardia sp. KRD291 TaxID=2792007 RepID=UPI001C4A0413|nr:hypothetical protein [Pseudonocardia sp. KRD291]MBW0102718.1 hypothetical protein [Pseudonocardia sp. KRD291]